MIFWDFKSADLDVFFRWISSDDLVVFSCHGLRCFLIGRCLLVITLDF